MQHNPKELQVVVVDGNGNVQTDQDVTQAQVTQSTSLPTESDTGLSIGEILTLKLEINKLSLENLQMQKEYTELQTKMQNIILDRIGKKKVLIEKLSEIYEAQKVHFDRDRQEHCEKIYRLINRIDEPTLESERIAGRIKQLKEQMERICARVYYLDSQIPEMQLVK